MSAVDDLLSNYQHVIEDLRLVTGAAGAFELTVDGSVLYSKLESGRHANDGEILEIFTDFVGADVARYGT